MFARWQTTIASSATPRTDSKPEVTLSGRVLVVEDVPMTRKLLQRILEKVGLTVSTAENGAQAMIRALAAESDGAPFDVVLMDMQMPCMDGYEATRQLRSQHYDRPIVALTAHALPEQLEECLVAGCNDCASKPIKRDALLALLHQYVKFPS